MAGGPGTAELVAAVSNAGGLGSIGAAYLTPDQITEQIQRVRKLTSKPFSVNLFAGGYDSEARVDPGPILELLGEIHEAFGLPAPTLPVVRPNPLAEQLEAVLETRPAAFSFTFGIPASGALSRLRSRGIAIFGTATTVEEARMLQEAQVDGIIAQGAEAGAHRGTFSGSFEAAMVPTLDLVETTVRFARAPVFASGGIMDGADIAKAMACGASGVQLGTAFLTCPESGAPEAHKQAILGARKDTTVITRAFSGRPARGLTNAFIEKLKRKQDAILPFPLQNALTRAMRTAAAQRGDAGYLSLWAGTGLVRARSMPAAKLVTTLVEEMNGVMQK